MNDDDDDDKEKEEEEQEEEEGGGEEKEEEKKKKYTATTTIRARSCAFVQITFYLHFHLARVAKQLRFLFLFPFRFSSYSGVNRGGFQAGRLTARMGKVAEEEMEKEPNQVLRGETPRTC